MQPMPSGPDWPGHSTPLTLQTHAAVCATPLRLRTCCSTVNVPRFVENMYQWAATLTQSGANYPFVLPLKTDKYESGFKARWTRGTCTHACACMAYMVHIRMCT